MAHGKQVSIPDRIRAARARAGLSQRALAALLGVDKSAVAQWEGGGGGVGIRTTNLVELARVLGVRPSELLGEPSRSDQMLLDDQDEITLLTLFRKLPRDQQDLFRKLLFIHTDPGQRPEFARDPTQRRHVARS